MYPINSLIFNSWCPPRVCENDLISSHEVETDRADGEGGKEDGAGGVGVEGCEGGIAGGGAHGAVDSDEGVVVGRELGLDYVEEGGPLAEDDGFSTWFLVGGSKDFEQGFDFAACGVGVNVWLIDGFAQFDRRTDEGIEVERFGATHGAAMLGVYHALDTFIAEYVGAGGDDGVVEIIEADWAVFVRFDANLEHIL